MTQEGLESLKAVARKVIELQVNATLVMATLQSIYCDEEDGLDQDAEEHLRSATASARGVLEYALSTTTFVEKAYGIERAIARLEDKLDNDTTRTE